MAEKDDSAVGECKGMSPVDCEISFVILTTYYRLSFLQHIIVFVRKLRYSSK